MPVRPPTSLIVGTLGVGLIVAGTALAPAAGAAAPVSQASGRFLSGMIGNRSLDQVAALDGEQAANYGGAAVTHEHSLAASLLGQQLLHLPGGIQLPGAGVLTLGAVNQYAQADPDGSAHGASGAITNEGAIALGGASGGQGSATLDLDPTKLALPGAPTVGIGHLKLTVGALAATADQAPGAGGAQRGGYRLGDVRLEIASPLLAQTVGTLFGQLQRQLSGTPLHEITDALSHADYGNGAIVGSLSGGSLTVDVGKLLAYVGYDINHLPPNTHLLEYLADAFPAMLASGPGNLRTVLGQLLADPQLNSLKSLIDGLLGQLQQAAQQGEPTLKSFLGQLATQAQNLIDPIANVQQRSGGMFVERALHVDLIGDPAAVLDLATATVGPGTGPLPPTPAPASPAPPHTGAPAPPQPTGLAYTGAATTWLTKAGLFGLLGLCLGAALVGATIGVRRTGRHSAR